MSDISFQYVELCKATREHALDVVNAFCHPSNCVHAPIAGIKRQGAEWAYYPSEMEMKSKL